MRPKPRGQLKTSDEKRREQELRQLRSVHPLAKDPFDELREMDRACAVAEDDLTVEERRGDGLDDLDCLCCPPRIVADNDFESTIRGGLDDDLLPDPPSTKPAEESALGDLDATLPLEEGFGGPDDPGVPDVTPGEWREP